MPLAIGLPIAMSICLQVKRLQGTGTKIMTPCGKNGSQTGWMMTFTYEGTDDKGNVVTCSCDVILQSSGYDSLDDDSNLEPNRFMVAPY